MTFALWPIIVLGASVLQVARNAAQRELTGKLGLWGATYVRFLFGLPFALVWTAAILLWRGPSGGPSAAFGLWVLLGAASQAGATASLVYAMRGRAFAVATAFAKTEVMASALIGVALIHDHVTPNDWIGISLGSIGILLMVQVSLTREAFNAALGGIASGVQYGVSAVAYRAAALEWGGDPWMGAAASLSSTLLVQTICGGALMLIFARASLHMMLKEWRACLVPGAAGGISSALLFTGFALGPSTGAVKSISLIDVILAWIVSRRLFAETIRPGEALGIALILAGALVVVL